MILVRNSNFCLIVIFVLNLILSINISLAWYKLNTKCFVVAGVTYIENSNKYSYTKNVTQSCEEFEIVFCK